MGRDDHCTELTREELYAQVWAEPMTSLAQRYGLSDRGLAKICTTHGHPGSRSWLLGPGTKWAGATTSKITENKSQTESCSESQ